MDPATLAFATMIGQLIVNDAIPLARQLVALVYKPDPTLADWMTLLDTAEAQVDASLAQLAKEGVKPVTLPATT